MVERIVDDVVDRRRVLLVRLDHLRPVPAAEDVILPLVPFVEGARVASVEVAHPLGEVRHGGLDEEVVVVAHQAAHVSPPAVTPFDPAQDVEEDDPVSIVEHDRRVVVAPNPDVVVGAGGEVTVGPSHLPKVALRNPPAPGLTLSLQVRLGPVPCQARDWGRGSIAFRDVPREDGMASELGRDFGALEMLVRRAIVALRMGRALAGLALSGCRAAARDAAVQGS